MSRSIARAISGVVRFLVRPLGARQRNRVLARVIDELQRDELATVMTGRGTLRFRQLSSPFAASLVARFHQDEPETLAWIDGFAPGEILWDIGANIGLYSLYAALSPDVRVYAFEPSGYSFGPLVDHIALNGLGERVRPFCIAFGSRTELGELCMSHTGAGHGSNSLNVAANQFGQFEPVFRQAVIAYSVDSFRAAFWLPAPDHLKLDVDGLEVDILRGATGTLPEVRSVLVEVEGESGSRAEAELEALLRTAGLREDRAFRAQGSGRNRLFRRATGS
jgi:FkbM family methyltransferase